MFSFVLSTTLKYWKMVVSNIVIQMALLLTSFLLILSLTSKQFEVVKPYVSDFPLLNVNASYELLFSFIAVLFTIGIILRLFWVPFVHGVLTIEASKHPNKKIRRKGAYLSFKFIMALFSGNLAVTGFIVLLIFFETRLFTSVSFLTFPALVFFLPKLIKANSKKFGFPFSKIKLLQNVSMPIFWRFFAASCLEIWFIFHLVTLYLMDFVSFNLLLIQAVVLRSAIYNFKKILIFIVLLFTFNDMEEEV